MKITKLNIKAFFLLFSSLGFSQQAPQLGKNSIQEVIAAMTLEEKINFVKGIGMVASTGDGPVAGSIEGKVPGAAGSTLLIERLGIPAIIMADGPAGLRIEPKRKNDTKTYYASAFPVGTALASTWNTNMMKTVGKAIGKETLEYGVDVILAPGLNIQRNPLCGRNFEYFSEDPYVSGTLAAAIVEGIQSNGVGTSVKHFAANNQETSRNTIDEVISQRALREIYLRGFEIAIKRSDPWTVMSSYNKINGVYTSESRDLLTTILRDEWKYKGMVTTDWFAGRNYDKQVIAGNDLLMPGRIQESKKIKESLDNHTLTIKDLDRNIEKIFELIIKTPTFKNYKYSDKPDLKASAKVAREAASEGMILLKNNATALPLVTKKIALIGNASYDTFVGGTGSGEVNKAYTIPFWQGLQEAGFIFDARIKDAYFNYIQEAKSKLPKRAGILDVIKPVEEKNWSDSELEQLAQENDTAVLTVGRNAGEGSDRKVDVDYELSPKELSLISRTSKAFRTKGKKLVVVLNIDALIDVAKWRDDADAILISWLPGQEAGYAMADVMSGKVSPSGHLTQTMPMYYDDVPSAKYFPGEPNERPKVSSYEEGIYVGYRYYNTFNKPVAYEFGYGLSYTTFAIQKLSISSKNFSEILKISTTVKNTGRRSGKEVVQLYISAPGKSMDKPESELKRFTKTRILEAKASEKINFLLNASDLASFDTRRSAWVVEPGTYTVKIGNSSKNIHQTASFNVSQEIVVEKVNNILAPQQVLVELKK